MLLSGIENLVIEYENKLALATGARERAVTDIDKEFWRATEAANSIALSDFKMLLRTAKPQ